MLILAGGGFKVDFTLMQLKMAVKYKCGWKKQNKTCICIYTHTLEQQHKAVKKKKKLQLYLSTVLY